MAVGDSIIGIVNSALIALQSQPIKTITDNVKSAILANLQWDSTRREVLRSHPWRCANIYAALAASPVPPAFGYANAYPLPSGCLRVLDCPDLSENVEWEVVGTALFTDADAPLNVIYTTDLQDVTQWDSLLAAAVAMQLAANIGMAVTGSADKVKAAEMMLDRKIKTARLVSSQEASSRELSIDVLLASRR
jgi:hypothetical protein